MFSTCSPARIRDLFWRLAVTTALVWMTAPARAQDAPSIQFSGNPERPVFTLKDWQGAPQASLPAEHEWSEFFAVFVADPEEGGEPSVPPLLGGYRHAGGSLIFEPRFPLQPGLHYRAVYRPQGKNTAPGEAIVADFDIPKAEAAPTTVVEQVYPTTDRLPENLLKFYLYFSAAMSRGEVYKRVRLLDASRRRVPAPFLELEQELWDGDGRRLTLLFDPGRVKRELLPNREVGLAIREGNRYTLVIDRGWPDADGKPLKKEFRKPFQVGPPDYEPPSLQTWKITSPEAGTRDPVTVRFPEPLDYALLLRVLHVRSAAGKPVGGVVEVDAGETRWRLRPHQPWQAGSYRLDVETVLEDLAGNSLDRPFEVDVFEEVEDQVVRATQTLRFTVASGASR